MILNLGLRNLAKMSKKHLCRPEKPHFSYMPVTANILRYRLSGRWLLYFAARSCECSQFVSGPAVPGIVEVIAAVLYAVRYHKHKMK